MKSSVCSYFCLPLQQTEVSRKVETLSGKITGGGEGGALVGPPALSCTSCVSRDKFPHFSELSLILPIYNIKLKNVFDQVVVTIKQTTIYKSALQYIRLKDFHLALNFYIEQVTSNIDIYDGF